MGHVNTINCCTEQSNLKTVDFVLDENSNGLNI